MSKKYGFVCMKFKNILVNISIFIVRRVGDHGTVIQFYCSFMVTDLVYSTEIEVHCICIVYLLVIGCDQYRIRLLRYYGTIVYIYMIFTKKSSLKNSNIYCCRCNVNFSWKYEHLWKNSNKINGFIITRSGTRKRWDHLSF